jgi:hypothetical protein
VYEPNKKKTFGIEAKQNKNCRILLLLKRERIQFVYIKKISFKANHTVVCYSSKPDHIIVTVQDGYFGSGKGFQCFSQSLSFKSIL